MVPNIAYCSETNPNDYKIYRKVFRHSNVAIEDSSVGFFDGRWALLVSHIWFRIKYYIRLSRITACRIWLFVLPSPRSP